MNNFSIVDKLKILLDVIMSSPLFFGCTFIVLGLLFYCIACTIMDKKINKWIYIGILTLIAFIILLNYGGVLLNIIDNLFDNVFMALYFPNLAIYVIVLVISNIFLTVVMIKKDTHKLFKIITIMNASVINVLLILIIGIVSKNNINVYEQLTVYSNANLLVLLELSMGVFTSWILLSLFISAFYKIKKLDNVEKEMPELIFDD